MNCFDTSDSVGAVQRLKQEIEKLTQEQREALKTATFVGMTPQQAQHYDARRQRITALFEQLKGLESSNPT